MPEKYKYYATSRIGTRQLTPFGKLKVSGEKSVNDFRRGYVQKFTGRLTFTGEDFNWFYSLETTTYRCEAIAVSISKYCAGIYVDDWQTGTISFNSGDWDLDQCKVSFEIEVEDKYTCYEDNKDTELNLLNYITGSRQTITLISGTLDYYSCTRTYDGGVTEDPDPCPQPTGSGWTLYHLKIEINYIGSPGRVEYYDYARYDLGGGEYAPAIVYGPVSEYLSDGSGSSNETTWQISGADESINEIDNGMPLRDVFQTFINEHCEDLVLKSDFFQWNPDDVTDINYVTGEESKVLNLILFQKSDVKRPNVSSNATIAEISFEDLLKNICIIFNMQWDIQGSDFIIEHYSFWQQDDGLDLTESRYAKFVRFKNKYSYATDKMPKYERFKFMEADGADFRGRDITYESACVNKKQGTDEQIYEADLFTTDITMCLSNTASDSAKVSDDGFVLVACDEDNFVLTEAPILTGDYQVNNTLGWAQLHRDYHKHGRVLLEGFMNGALTTFLSSIKTKQQEKLSIPLCCDDDFDPYDLITTGLGEDADVLQYDIDLSTDMLELQLVFDANIALVDNEAPVAVNDSLTMVKNSSADIGVVDNDTDADGTIDPASVTIVSGPYHGSAVPNGDGTISYTPDTDYVGADNFSYTITDDLGEVSNIATVNITVTATADAINDTYVAFKNETRTIPAPGVLGNDVEVSGTVSAYDAVSVNGGTVVVNANGSFTYLAAVDYTGADSFTYTLDDGGFTDVATVNITVQERVMIYARLTQTLVNTIPFNASCSGVPTEIGRREESDVLIEYFSDSGATTQIDIEAYGLTVNIRRHTEYNYTGTNANSDSSYTTTTGTSKLYLNNGETHRSLYNCDGSFNGFDFDDTYSLLTGTGYTII